MALPPVDAQTSCMAQNLRQGPRVSVDEHPTAYSILGVPVTATNIEIRTAFRKLARIHHPDRIRQQSGDTDGGEEAKHIFQLVAGAYEVLSDRSKRLEYDMLHCLELLDLEDYLSRFQSLILTASGLGIASRCSPPTQLPARTGSRTDTPDHTATSSMDDDKPTFSSAPPCATCSRNFNSWAPGPIQRQQRLWFLSCS
mmetsp:Transcript_8822/g.15272  ORF Transcript_8822/g.15272 Transcript_8822/m.15272 type:complete len:198 (-) Transcript_8822:219-812(-)